MLLRRTTLCTIALSIFACSVVAACGTIGTRVESAKDKSSLDGALPPSVITWADNDGTITATSAGTSAYSEVDFKGVKHLGGGTPPATLLMPWPSVDKPSVLSTPSDWSASAKGITLPDGTAVKEFSLTTSKSAPQLALNAGYDRLVEYFKTIPPEQARVKIEQTRLISESLGAIAELAFKAALPGP